MSSSALKCRGFFSFFFRRQLTAEGTLVVNCSQFLTSVVNCRRDISFFICVFQPYHTCQQQFSTITPPLTYLDFRRSSNTMSSSTFSSLL